MKFIHINAPGEADVLQLGDMPTPVPAAGEVLIRVAAIGVNRPDVLQRKGVYPPPADASPVLGLEVAGEIVACGTSVTRWQVGDKVCALVNGGGYAEFALAPASQCLPVPASLSLLEAAALPETFFTVWHNLFQRARLQTGETLLIHGGSSGIGTTAIQMARANGIKVFVTAGSAEKCTACEKLGADKAINYREADFVSEIKTLTDGRGVDVILDMVGGDYIQRNIACAARDGRIVNIAYLNGSEVQVNFMPVMLKRLTLTGSTLRAQSPVMKAKIAQELEEFIWPLIEEEKIKPVIAARFPLAQAAEAHRLMESSQHIGKIMLVVDEDN